MMGEINQKRKISFITEFILFLFIVLITILLLKQLNISELLEESSNLAMYAQSDTDIRKENESYIKKIKDEYSINIKYGKDTEDYMGKIEGNAQYNEAIINNNIKLIYYALKKYPDDVFDMSRNKKYPITIVIIDKFNNNNLALASRNNLNEFRIYISNTPKFERAFHHEMYHVLEYYMSDTQKYLFASWDKLNPSNFKYEEDISLLDDKYVYKENSLIDESNIDVSNNEIIDEENVNPYFVTKYSKVTEKEDRAEIFAEVMILNKKVKFLEEGQNIRKKVDYISEILSECITKEDFYFYRFL